MNKIKFLQSIHDFPCLVELGKKPSWGIKRWDGCNGLRFVPADDEGFSLRGDGRRLLYKGRKKSHRITILGDTAFEYDCILEREPESNVVSLRMEGADQFDFFRQPDFVKDPFLKGSYAVYKKETMIGEGTGKLCHIHRPLVIDALGRKVWGELAVIGDELRITIPEQWLAGAKYPVVVDPTVGTATVGKQNFWDDDPFYDAVYFSWDIAVNRFYAPETIKGECTAFVYVYEREADYGGYCAVYSDSGNKPVKKLSTEEEWFELEVPPYQMAWKSGTLYCDNPISGGSYIWFGIVPDMWWALFDYGSTCRFTFENSIYYPPNNFPGSHYTLDMKLSMYFTYTASQNYVRTLTQGVNLTDSRKLTSEYRRLMAQTVPVTDSRAIKTEYQRTTTQIVHGADAIAQFQNFFRQCVLLVNSTLSVTRLPVFSRAVTDEVAISETNKNTRVLARKCDGTAKTNDVTDRAQSLIRELRDDPVGVIGNTGHTAEYRRETYQSVEGATAVNTAISFFRQCVMNVSSAMNLCNVTAFLSAIIEHIGIVTGIAANRYLSRRCDEAVEIHSEAKREQGFFGVILDMVKASDTNRYSAVFFRTVSETQGVTDTIRQCGNYIRGLYVEAGNIAETVRWGDYYRSESDTVQAEGTAFRQTFFKTLTFWCKRWILKCYIINKDLWLFI